MDFSWIVRSFIGLVVLAVIVSMFGLIGLWALGEGRLDFVDKLIIQADPDHPLTQFLVVVSSLGSVTGVAIISIIMLLILIWRKHFRGAAALFLSALTAAYANDFVKEWVARARPTHSEHFEATGFSYLSGHAFVCTTVFGLFAYLVIQNVKETAGRWLLGITAVVILGLIGFSRIYLGVHYPSDVIGGYVLGIVWIAVWATVFAPLNLKAVRRNGVQDITNES